MKPFATDYDSYKDSQTWFSKQNALVQAAIITLPILLLTVAVTVLAVLYSQELIAEETKSEVCISEACVLASNTVLSYMNRSVNPCDDFYEYACGGYVASHSIPDGYGASDYATSTTIMINTYLKQLLEDPAPQNEPEARAKTRLYYKTCLDQSRNQQEAYVVLNKLVADLGGFYLLPSSQVPDVWSLEQLLDKRSAYSLNGLFRIFVGPDILNVSINNIQMTQGGLTYDRSAYIGKDVSKDPNLVKYTQVLVTVAQTIAGSQSVNIDVVREVVIFEQHLAEAQLAPGDPGLQMTDKQNIDWLNSNSPFMNWTLFVTNLFKPFKTIEIKTDEPVILGATEYFFNLSSLMKNYLGSADGRRTLQNYIIFQAMISYYNKVDPSLISAVDYELKGIKGSISRSKFCLKDVNENFGDPLGAIYIDAYFSELGKQKALHVVEHVKAAFRQRIAETGWLDLPTRQQALIKIEKMKYDAGYPEYLKNDTFLDVLFSTLPVGESYVYNQVPLYQYLTFTRMLSQLHKTPDTTLWSMPPQTVNAYYTPSRNMFIVEAGYLVPPEFYQDVEMPHALNLGAVGAVVGHEIGHGFDNNGRQYDSDGNRVNWWSADSLAAFNNRSQCLVDQYSQFYYAGMYVNGQLTLGENIADNGGMKAAFDAFKTSMTAGDYSVPAGLQDMFNKEQLFFVAYAQQWCVIYNDASAQWLMKNDPHTPSMFRVTGPLRNSPEFASTFNCPLESAMNPSHKCSVW